MEVITGISAKDSPSASESPKKRRLIPAHGTPSGNAKKILLVAIDVLRANPRLNDLDDFKEALKLRCAQLHLAYDSEVVGAGAEIAMARRAKDRRRK